MALLLALAGRAGAQPAADSWLADASGAYRYAAIQEPLQRLHEYGFRADFLFFPLHRLAVGARLSNQYLAFNDEFFQAYDLGFTVEPILRYYVGKRPLPWFVQAGAYWQRAEAGQFSIAGPSREGLGWSLGAGANLFFAQRGGLEGLLEYRYREALAESGMARAEATHNLALGARLRAYLGSDGEGDPLSGPGLAAVRAGNWMAGGRLGGLLSLDSPDHWDVDALGSIFLAKRLALGVGVVFQGFPGAARLEQGAFNRSIEPFLRYYFELTDNLLLFPTLGYMLGRSDSTTRLGFTSTAFNTWRLGLGMDNFLSPALALEFIFAIAGRTASPSLAASPRDFDLSFGLSVGLVAYWR
jgi:hypothetical protein